jgi:hypothetical protein
MKNTIDQDVEIEELRLKLASLKIIMHLSGCEIQGIQEINTRANKAEDRVEILNKELQEVYNYIDLLTSNTSLFSYNHLINEWLRRNRKIINWNSDESIVKAAAADALIHGGGHGKVWVYSETFGQLSKVCYLGKRDKRRSDAWADARMHNIVVDWENT